MPMKIPFHERARTFNKTFGLPHPSVPTLGNREAFAARIRKVQEMLHDEIVREGNELQEMALDPSVSELTVLTAASDWLGDIQVYAATEMVRHGLPAELVLDCIMDSQDTKLAPDGSPIVKDGKVVKGPNYRPPEPDISLVLDALMDTAKYDITENLKAANNGGVA